MRPSKAIDLIKPMLTQPSFTAKEARTRGVHPALLSYYIKKGVLEQVRRGVYRGTHSPAAPEPINFQWGDLIEAVKAIPNGTVCLISALAFYGITEEIAREHWIAVRHDTTAKAGPGVRIIRYRNADLGKTEVDLDGIRFSIYDRERTILDAFRLLTSEIAIKALKFGLSGRGKEKLDLVKLQKYAKKLRVPIKPYLMTVTT